MGFPEVGTLIDDKLELVRLLGEGGMGAVFEAIHLRTGRRVALKMIRPGLSNNANVYARFVQEAYACGKVRSPHVVDILDAGTHDDLPYLVMEFLEGESLGERLEREGFLPLHDALEIALQVLDGLVAVHAMGMIHRDIKPDNIFLTRDSREVPCAKLVDFGIAKLTLDALGPARTQTGHAMGTPYYMAPEQAQGMKLIDARADVYALGATLFHIVTGRLPHEGDSLFSIVSSILMNPAPSVRDCRPGLPASFDSVVRCAMDREPARRFASAADFRDALARTELGFSDTLSFAPSVIERPDPPLGTPSSIPAIESDQTPPEPIEFARPARRTGVSRRTSWIAAAVAAIAAVALTVTWWMQRGPSAVVRVVSAEIRVPSRFPAAVSPAPVTPPVGQALAQNISHDAGAPVAPTPEVATATSNTPQPHSRRRPGARPQPVAPAARPLVPVPFVPAAPPTTDPDQGIL